MGLAVFVMASAMEEDLEVVRIVLLAVFLAISTVLETSVVAVGKNHRRLPIYPPAWVAVPAMDSFHHYAARLSAATTAAVPEASLQYRTIPTACSGHAWTSASPHRLVYASSSCQALPLASAP